MYDNYRPISIISNISKLLEKLVHERFYSFFEKGKLLFERQYGFRNKRSTTDALTDIAERIRNACDKGYYACGAFLDFRKAFDTVNHKILLTKLIHCGIRGQAFDWFQSFLSHRVQYTSVSGFDSEPSLVTHGVQQGSVLGSLVFIMFINDLHKSVKHSQILHFADGTNLLYANKSMKKVNKHINHDLSLIVQWLRSNKLSLNADKIEIITFRSKRKQITKYLNFRISGQKLNVSNKVRYLGIEIEQHIDWNVHVKNVIPKLNRAIDILSKIRHYVPIFLLKSIYYSLFNSHLFMPAKCGVKIKNSLKNCQLCKTKQ